MIILEKKKKEQKIKKEMEEKYKHWNKISEKSGPNYYSLIYEGPPILINSFIDEFGEKCEEFQKPKVYSHTNFDIPCYPKIYGSSYNSFDNIIKTKTLVTESNEDKLLDYYAPKKDKMKLNIIYYSDSLLKDMETSDYCAYLQMNIKGTFYGCHNMNLLNIICDKIRKSDRDFILITSGSSAEKVYNKISNLNNIKEYYIYCFYKEKYTYLKNKYYKLKGIYNNYHELNEKLSKLETKVNEGYRSSNLIFFEDYVRIYVKLHFEIIRKYSLYKLLKQNNFDQEKFLSKVKKANPKFLSIAKQLLPDKDEIIKYFQNKLDLSYKEVSEVFNETDSVENYISNYTAESFYYRSLNKFLREGDFDSFRILSSHLSKFIYYLYEYREKNLQVNYNLTLYRKMKLDDADINVYKKSIGRVICFPSFTSTSSDKDGFFCFNNVLLIINSNNSKSVVSIENFSQYKSEKEYLFLPFSFFKITNFKLGKGNSDNPHIINLLAMKSDKPIEEMFLDFFKNYSDSLDAEGLDIIQIYGDKIYFNKNYYW